MSKIYAITFSILAWFLMVLSFTIDGDTQSLSIVAIILFVGSAVCHSIGSIKP